MDAARTDATSGSRQALDVSRGSATSAKQVGEQPDDAKPDSFALDWSTP
jgi:hypothetical protein